MHDAIGFLLAWGTMIVTFALAAALVHRAVPSELWAIFASGALGTLVFLGIGIAIDGLNGWIFVALITIVPVSLFVSFLVGVFMRKRGWTAMPASKGVAAPAPPNKSLERSREQ